MKSECSAIWSSVMPISSNSSNRPFCDGSFMSKGRSAFAGNALGICTAGGATGIEGAGAAGGVGLGVGLRCNKLPKIDLPGPFPLATGAGPCPRVEAKGVLVVSLLACFSRSCIFLMKVFASFSSAKDRPAGQSSSSNVWKKVRSWL